MLSYNFATVGKWAFPVSAANLWNSLHTETFYLVIVVE